MSIRLLLVDDHPLLRRGVRARLESEPDFLIVGEAASGLEALKKVETLQPDVIILDLGIPELTGLEISRHIHKVSPLTRIVVLSMHDREAYIVEMFQQGALAYVLKGADDWELIHAIREAALGRRYLSSQLNQIDLETYFQKAILPTQDPLETLTNRERQIMLLAAEGWSNQEIAEKLVISQRTVEVHRARMMHKLKLQNQAELVHYVLRHHLLPMDDE